MNDELYYLYSPGKELIGKYKTKRKLLKDYNIFVKFNSFLFDYSLLIEFEKNKFRIEVFY